MCVCFRLAFDLPYHHYDVVAATMCKVVNLNAIYSPGVCREIDEILLLVLAYLLDFFSSFSSFFCFCFVLCVSRMLLLQINVVAESYWGDLILTVSLFPPRIN